MIDTRKEQAAALHALMSWFQSQRISPRDACGLCAQLCGILAKERDQIDALVNLLYATHEETHGE
jgi:hypothetical protein